MIGEGFLLGSSDRQNESGGHPTKRQFTVRLVPAGSSDAPERLRKAYELILTVVTKLSGEVTFEGGSDATISPSKEETGADVPT